MPPGQLQVLDEEDAPQANGKSSSGLQVLGEEDNPAALPAPVEKAISSVPKPKLSMQSVDMLNGLPETPTSTAFNPISGTPIAIPNQDTPESKAAADTQNAAVRSGILRGTGVSGIPKIARGLADVYLSGSDKGGAKDEGFDPFAKPNPEEAKSVKRGATELLQGAGEVSTPFASYAAATEPLKIAAGFGAGAGASYAAGKLAHGKVDPETEELLKTAAFWIPSLAGEAFGLKGDVASTPEAKAAAASAFGNRVQAGAAVTPEEVVLAGKIGSKTGQIRIPRINAQAPQRGIEPPTINAEPPDQAAVALAQHEVIQQRAARVYQGKPPVEPPPPPAPVAKPSMPEISPETVSQVGKLISKLPPPLRAKGIIEAHGNLSQAILQQGKVVGPDGQLHIVKTQDQADSIAQKIINEEVKNQDTISAGSSGESASRAGAEEQPTPSAPTTPGKSRARAAELAKGAAPQFKSPAPQLQVLGEEEAPAQLSVEGEEEPGVESAGEKNGVEEQVGDRVPAVEGKSAKGTPESLSNGTSGAVEKAAFQKGDQVLLKDGRKAEVTYVHPSMGIVRVRTEDGQKASVGARSLQRADGSQPIESKPQTEPVKQESGVPAPGKVGEMKVSDLKVAPNKFQYKMGTDAEGVGTLLKEAKVFNPDLAGQVSVWRDPSDGKTYVVNGHHRIELAKRTGQRTVVVRHIKAKDAVAARAIGAQQNIAEGRGTAIDAAKYFRDTGTTAQHLEEKGISLGEATAKNGLALSHLDPSIFNKVVSGDLRQGRAIAIGEATGDPAEQIAILSLVEKREAKGAKVSDDTLSELIRLVKGSEQTQETTADLFGSREITRSLALEKAEISAHIKQQLSKDKKLFGFVAKEGRASELARAGNKIDVEKSKEVSTGAAQAEEVYDKLSSRGGPISSILDESARRLADGENAGTVKSEAYQRIRAEVSKTLSGTEERSAGRSEGTSEPARSGEAGAGEPEGSIKLFQKEYALIKGRSPEAINKTAQFSLVDPGKGLPKYVRLNPAAMAIIHEASGDRSFRGVNMSVEDSRELVKGLKKIEAKYPVAKDLIPAIEKATDPESGLSLVKQGKTPEEELATIHEELTHSAVQRQPGKGDLTKGIPYKEMASDPGIRAMGERITYYEVGDPRASAIRVVAEGMADIITGEAQELTPEQAGKTAERYYDLVAQKHGIEPLQASQALYDYIDKLAENRGIIQAGEQFNGKATKPAREALSRVIARYSGKGTEERGGKIQEVSEGRVPERSSESGRETPAIRSGNGEHGGSSIESGEGTAPTNLRASVPIGLSDEELESWAKNKSFRAEPVGEQPDLFGGPSEKIFRVYRAVGGKTESALVYENQLDRQGIAESSQQQPSLFKSESGEMEPGKIAEAITKAAGTLGDFLRAEAEDNHRAHELQWDMYDLYKMHEARILRAKQLLEQLNKDGVTKEDRAAIDDHLEALQADSDHVPVPALTPKQDEILDKVLLPLKEESEAAYKKVSDGGVTIPGYNPRQTKDKGGFLDRILTPKGERWSGRGNLLSQSMPASKHRTMMSLEAPGGRRLVVSINGNRVSASSHGKMEDMGPLSSGMTTKLDTLSKKLEPIAKRIIDLKEQISSVPEQDKKDRVDDINDKIAQLKKDRDLLSEVKGRKIGEKAVYGQEVTFGKRKAISEKIESLEKERERILSSGHMSNAGEERVRRLKENLAVVENQRARLLESTPTEDLLDKTWVDKNGKHWKLGQATTNEIEAQSPVRYYHDAVASTLVNWLQAKKAEAAYDFVENFKNSPDFDKVAVKTDASNPPKGWRTTNLPQFKGYYFEPHTAEVFDWFNDRLKSGDTSALDALNNWMRVKILLNPIKHPMNIGAQWAIDKGITGFLPHRWLKIGKTGSRAISDVWNQGEGFIQALENGGALQSAHDATSDIQKLFFDTLSQGLNNSESWALRTAKAIGFPPVTLVKMLHDFSSKIAWPISDMLYLQSAYERMADHPGMSLKDAMREAGRTIPDYRLPVRILNSTTVSKLMSSKIGTIFGSYKYGLLKSFSESAKSAMGLHEVPTGGGSKGEDVAEGWNRLAMMALGAFFVYALLDELAKKATGDQDAKLSRHGVFALIDAAHHVATKEETPTQALTRVVTPNPATLGLAQLAFNRDFRTGRNIYDPAADWGIERQQLGQYLLEQGLPEGQQLDRAANTEDGWKKFALAQADLTFPKHGPEKVAQQIASSKMDTSAWTPEQRDQYYARQRAMEGLRKGDSKALEEGLTSGKIRMDELASLLHRSSGSQLVDKVHNFSYQELLKVYEAPGITEEQQTELIPLLLEKQEHLIEQGRLQEAGVQ